MDVCEIPNKGFGTSTGAEVAVAAVTADADGVAMMLLLELVKSI